uniref:Uncharacterized protein n=1 Tax=Ananas comosus var. bracteatus TaxID=296719 RepID=A0A6V7QSF8_ANACO
MNKEQSSFWQFSDQLRLETTNLSNLSIGDSIWSDSFVKRPEDRRNYETPISAAAAAAAAAPDVSGWKTGFGMQQKLAFGNTNSGLLDRYNTNNNNNNNNNNSAASSKNSYKNGPSGGG